MGCRVRRCMRGWPSTRPVVLRIWVTGRIVPALATAWGLVWLAVGRLSGEPESTPTAITAIIVAVLLVVVGVVAVRRARTRVTHSTSR